MTKYFSRRVDFKIVTPTYPRTTAIATNGSTVQRLSNTFLGDEQTRTSILEFDPEVIYSDSPLYAAHLKLSQLALKKRIPTIVHLRGDLWREYFSFLQEAHYKARLFGSLPYLEGFLGLGLSQMLTPICKWLQREVLRHLPSKASEVVYQGVDPVEFYPSPGLSLERPAVAIIQNHSVYEKTRGLLNFASVVEELTEVHFYITTGESVRQQYLPLVKTAFSRFANVHFLSDIDRPNGVRKLLTSSDVYVLPSYQDCCPTTILEASLMEKPVLGSRVGGVPELILHGHTGWTIPNGDTDQWVARIRSLIDDPKLSARIGRHGRKWVCENFGWEKIASQVERLITDYETSMRRRPADEGS
jgi:glycosyltransferase involved in cell wall biosynthesis